MVTLIAAVAVAAAQPANAPANGSHSAKMQIGGGLEQNGQLADMKNCCSKSMMSKLNQSHRPGHAGHSAQ